MEHISTFFKEENDILYRIGEKEGGEKAQAKMVKNLLLQTDFTVAKIASIADVPEEFVINVKNGMKAKK